MSTPRHLRRARHAQSFSFGGVLRSLTAISCICYILATPARDVYSSVITQPAPQILTQTSADTPVSLAPLLSWMLEADAISYEIEFFSDAMTNLNPQEVDKRAIFRTREVYTNEINLPLDTIRIDLPASQPLWWRVRALGVDGEPISPFSLLAPLYTNPDLPRMNAPLLRPIPKSGKGSALLYPVYSWVRLCGAVGFEVALYDANPEEQPDLAPIALEPSPIAELYDANPRMGDVTYYWRVRSFDRKGAPLGTWSETASFRTEARHWDIAVLGDSISHGGGRLSYGPENLEYSWLSYLDFAAINLSQSGNITRDMVERFERDVLPFSPTYLLIMGGTNDLRSDEFTLEEAIANMEALKDKCREYGIKPIFLTLPPIHPANIERAFDEPTIPDWQERFAAFNDYLRQQPHIDTAAAFAPYATNGELPEWLGLDGLHEDVIGKQLIAARINAKWEEARTIADEWE